MIIDQIHMYLGYAYTVTSGLVLVATGLSKALPKVGWLAAIAKGLGAVSADFSKLLGDKGAS